MDFIELLWAIHTEHRLGEVEREVHDTSMVVHHEHGRQIPDLTERLDHLNLVTAAIWELVSTHLNLSAPQLKDKIIEIDLRDGQLDGKQSSITSTCSGCARPMRADRDRCMYCGMTRRGQALTES